MKIKSCKATPRQLKWLVGSLQGLPVQMQHDYMRNKAAANNYPDKDLAWHLSVQPNVIMWVDDTGVTHGVPGYASDWGAGGPILTESRISRTTDHSGLWVAYWTDGYTADGYSDGDEGMLHMQCDRSELVAGLRCYVIAKLGEEVEVPDELA